MTTKEKTAAKVLLSAIAFYMLVSALAGCAPYAEYQHIDATPLHNDGMAYDLACVGLSHNKSGLSVSTGVCHNLHGGEFLTISARYTPSLR